MTNIADSIARIEEESPPPEEEQQFIEESTSDDPSLRMPAAEELIEGTWSASESDLEVFSRTGLILDEADASGQRDDLMPAILKRYIDIGSFRRPWPLIMSSEASGYAAKPLTRLIDEQIAEIEAQGDEAEVLKRAFFRLEELITKASHLTPVLPLKEILAEADITSTLKDDTAEAWTQALATLSALAGDDTLVLGLSAEGLRKLHVESSLQTSSARQRVFREEIAWLVSRLEDLLRMEEEDSEAAHSPEKLKHSVGGAYSSAIDFSSLSHLLDEAFQGASIGEEREVRIRNILKDLTDLSQLLYESGQTECFKKTKKIQSELRKRVANFIRLCRAKQIAQLEVENQYRPQIHDAVFETYGYAALSDSEKKAFPPVLAHINLDDADDISALSHIFADEGRVRILVTFSSLYDSTAKPVAGALDSLGLLHGSNLFVQQSAAAKAEFVAGGMLVAARSQRSSAVYVHTGTGSETRGIDVLLDSGLSADSRTFPSFRFDPENGSEWADWLSANENEQARQVWAADPTMVMSGEEKQEFVLSPCTADLLMLDAKLKSHFKPLSPSVSSEKLMELTRVLDLPSSDRDDQLPFIWTCTEDGTLLRTVVSPAVIRTTEFAVSRWETIQEWSGLRSSILNRGMAEARSQYDKDLSIAVEESRAEFDLQMNETVSTLASRIVGNIAASMLGVDSSELSATPGPDTAPRPAQDPIEPAQATVAESEESPTPVEEAEEVLSISLDEAYIDTPLCTSCNECTDLNAQIFGYDENKQAFFKDASAGPFRDIVLAAEKCPVRIIHPGKPLDDGEKDLDEWIERAKPFG